MYTGDNNVIIIRAVRIIVPAVFRCRSRSCDLCRLSYSRSCNRFECFVFSGWILIYQPLNVTNFVISQSMSFSKYFHLCLRTVHTILAKCHRDTHTISYDFIVTFKERWPTPIYFSKAPTPLSFNVVLGCDFVNFQH